MFIECDPFVLVQVDGEPEKFYTDIGYEEQAMKNYRFDFSVIMAVFNVEPYLKTAIDSIIRQTIGFSHIQIIMVDDGSTDKSGEICDYYKSKYPENTVVIHKENGGASSARNAGLPYVEGKYINFMDSDDKMDLTAFAKARSFFQKHGEETDVVALPMKYFDAETKEHIQNDKFRINKEVINLYEHPYVTNLSAASSFFNASSIEGISFDTDLISCEDAKYCLQVLLKKMTLGLIHDATYWYRKHFSGNLSSSQSATRKRGWYLPHLQHFSSWALDEAESRLGTIPRFVQYEVMYDLQWRVEQPNIPLGVMSEEQIREYKQSLFETINRIDDEVIIRQKNLSKTRQLYLIDKKHGEDYVSRHRCTTTEEKKEFGDINCGDIVFKTAEDSKLALSEMNTVLDFIKIDREASTCTVEGLHHVYRETAEPLLIVNGRAVVCETVDRERDRDIVLGEYASTVVGFKCVLPLEESMSIVPAIRVADSIVIRRNIQVGSFFPVSELYSKAYAIINKRLVTLQNGVLCVTRKPCWIKRTSREIKFLFEIWKKNYLGGRKAIAGRLFYHFYHPFKRRKIWILSDRLSDAGDNGEAFFDFLSHKKPKKTKVYYVIKKDSKDYSRLSNIGACIDILSFKHKLLHLVSDVVLSSQADIMRNPFGGHDEALRDLLQHQKFVFLQHGVTKDDISDWINRYHQNIDGFVTVAKREAQSITEGRYGYSADQVWLTGFPRFDYLYEDNRKWITVMPTWRYYLVENPEDGFGPTKLVDDYENTEFFKFYNTLLNADGLLSKLEEKGYTLAFFAHPRFRPFTKRFSQDSRVLFLPAETSYREIYAHSSLVITDYSSAAFDFSYLRKPVIYAQFDKDVFFSGSHSYVKGYFSYERDGFGEVTHDLEETIALILKYVEEECVLEPKYRTRIDEFFEYNDAYNSQRLLDKVTTFFD